MRAGTDESNSPDSFHCFLLSLVAWEVETMAKGTPAVGILMGSDSDWPKIQAVGEALDEFGVTWEVNVMSAHRTPDAVVNYVRAAPGRGVKVIIAAAGGAAHLAGVVAAHSTLPVIGIPVPTADLGGLDSLLSTVQMPGDVPVVSVAVGLGGPRNAGIFAVQILATADAALSAKLSDFKQRIATKIEAKNAAFQKSLAKESRP
jgi:5-(carboxyamino)imidazole ribonucleotide mutase